MALPALGDGEFEGLSLVQWDTLRHLHANPGASLHRLAELTFQTGQSMGELAKRMVDRGLLERVEGAGRKVQHELTATGEELRKAGGEAVDGVPPSPSGGSTPTSGRSSTDCCSKRPHRSTQAAREPRSGQETGAAAGLSPATAAGAGLRRPGSDSRCSRGGRRRRPRRSPGC
ncbi:hypothetical protein Axi01nite_38960 [Actinoplanes xinjiangensis]|nr:hypothetical protein Axi01nite_38960 [Actinoplanes xinjiangensis]